MASWQGTNPDELLAAHLAGDMTKPYRKKALRDELRRRMAERSGDSSVVAKEVSSYLSERPQAQVIALFAPLPGEVDLIPLTRELDRIWAFPKVEGDSLAFYHIKDAGKELKLGAFGILEPIQHLPRLYPDEIDLFLCPGLGFDARGGRIGRGKGFYDDTLAKARPDALKIGVCFGYQLVDEVVMEDHDIPMNGVIAG
jgi:5-formyltetrahydrofolate cyclo-ligase